MKRTDEVRGEEESRERREHKTYNWGRCENVTGNYYNGDVGQSAEVYKSEGITQSNRGKKKCEHRQHNYDILGKAREKHGILL